MRRVVSLLAVCSAVAALHAPNRVHAQAAQPQPWYYAVFPERSHDFGTVAKGTKLRHSFKLINTTSSDIHIVDTRKKCGCTEVAIGARDIPPGTQTTIEMTLDTTRFTGYKPSGVTLIFDRPQFVEVDLNVSCFIRADVTMNPGVADFGVVPRGQARKMSMILDYMGGRADWQITNISTGSSNLVVEAKLLSRNGGSARYELDATIDDKTAPGYFKDEVTITTSEQGQAIPLSVSANVQSAVSVAPAILNLGRVKAGQKVVKTVLVRSSKNFKVTSANASKPDLKAAGSFDAEKPFHTLTLELVAPTQPGPYNATVEIGTNLADEPPAKVTAFATVVP